jgi:predicted outer membrane repeat protein
MGFNRARAAGVFLVAGLLVNTSNSAVFAATMTVGNLTDSVVDGDGCSLREAILNANGDNSSGSVDCVAGDGVDTIVFGLSGTILPASSLPAITDTDMLTIDGSGRAITLSGHNAVGVMVVSASGVLRLRDLEITQGNVAFGAGVYVFNPGSLTVERVRFTANMANFGGGIYNAGSLIATDTTFSGNTGFVQGGGIVTTGGGAALITRCTFAGNSGPSGGGGIFNQNGGAITVASSTFSGNSATFLSGTGGAIYSTSAQPVTIANSTFSANQAASAGSGIYNASGSLTITDSIIANGVTTANCAGAGGVSDGGGNLTWPLADQSCPGALGDPMLFPLGDNGGFTPTFELQAGSAAYDSALVVSCPAADQRGVTRPHGADCDIGAVEGLGVTGLIFWGDFEIDGYAAWSFTSP